MNLKHDIRGNARQFQIYGEFLAAESYGIHTVVTVPIEAKLDFILVVSYLQ
jgi:hypothetical protein